MSTGIEHEESTAQQVVTQTVLSPGETSGLNEVTSAALNSEPSHKPSTIESLSSPTKESLPSELQATLGLEREPALPKECHEPIEPSPPAKQFERILGVPNIVPQVPNRGTIVKRAIKRTDSETLEIDGTTSEPHSREDPREVSPEANLPNCVEASTGEKQQGRTETASPREVAADIGVEVTKGMKGLVGEEVKQAKARTKNKTNSKDSEKEKEKLVETHKSTDNNDTEQDTKRGDAGSREEDKRNYETKEVTPQAKRGTKGQKHTKRKDRGLRKTKTKGSKNKAHSEDEATPRVKAIAEVGVERIREPESEASDAPDPNANANPKLLPDADSDSHSGKEDRHSAGPVKNWKTDDKKHGKRSSQTLGRKSVKNPMAELKKKKRK